MKRLGLIACALVLVACGSSKPATMSDMQVICDQASAYARNPATANTDQAASALTVTNGQFRTMFMALCPDAVLAVEGTLTNK